MSLGEVTAWLPAWFLPGAAFAFGLLWGSFLNVVIYRVPREMSVVRPPSHCPGCGKPIAPYDNIPVLSYVILRGRARCCGTRMSPRYPMVELMGGALSLGVAKLLLTHLPDSVSIGFAASIYAADFALCMGLAAAAFIDAEHMFLPDAITIGGALLGVATYWQRGMTLTDTLTGAFVGFTLVWLPFTFLYKGLLGRTGMGVGDAKLVALAGAWFGWQGAVFALFAGALQGSLYALVLKVLGVEPKLPDAVLADIAELEKAAAEGDEDAKRELEADPLTEDEDDAFILRWLGFQKKKSEERDEAPADSDEEAEAEQDAPRARIPFGPFLILACLELLFAGDVIAHYLSRLFFRPF
jgi:leader peptidase (prepilin peptidase)/N-methyltransferase